MDKKNKLKIVIYYKSSEYLKSMRKDNEAQRADGNKGDTTIRVFDICIIRAPGLKSTLGFFTV
jgi:hypothetical protein